MIDIAVRQKTISSAYIHIPFCTHKCEFCDFAAVAGLSHLEDEYTEIICREIDERTRKVTAPIELSTIFFGGGTPGLVAPATLKRIYDALLKVAPVNEDIEFSMETTPHSISREKAKAWKELGINRLSIGIESLQDDELKSIGRDHSRAQALQGLEIASEFFTNINVDFMYGLPTQTVESWTDTLKQFIDLTKQFPSIKHVSAYCLELAVNSPLLMRFPRASQAYPEDEAICSLFEILIKTLTENGFQHYEVSNFARPGFASQHNLAYWRNQSYLAFGVGAHRYVDGVRSANFKSLARYMREYLTDEMRDPIDQDTRIKEGLMLGLRMRAGIDVEEFQRDYGLDLASVFAGQIEKLDSAGLIEFDGKILRISDNGVLLSNSVLTEFM